MDYKNILGGVDSSTKIADFIVMTNMNTARTANMFVKDIGQMQGLPECNVIDRMSLFVSGVWNTAT